MIQKLGAAFKKMSRQALMRGDRSKSEMIENHGLFGMRSNMLNDTPSYKKEGIGFDNPSQRVTLNQNNRNNNQNTKTATQITNNVQNNSSSTKLGGNILDALK